MAFHFKITEDFSRFFPDIHENNYAKDKHFVANWDLKEARKMNRLTLLLNVLREYPVNNYSKLQKIYDSVLDFVEKRHNDHRSFEFEVNGHDYLKVSPVNEVWWQEDLVTIRGLNKIWNIYNGTESGIFRYLNYGTGTTPPTVLDQKLESEGPVRYDATTLGFHDIKGSMLRVFITAPESAATITNGGTEVAAFDTSTINTGVMLYRQTLTGDGIIKHTANNSSYSIGSVIELIPVGD